VLDLLVFAHVDPADVHTLAGAPVALSRQAVYTLSFFGFWAVCAAAAATSLWLARTEPEGDVTSAAGPGPRQHRLR
jgi:hypothetical protein